MSNLNQPIAGPPYQLPPAGSQPPLPPSPPPAQKKKRWPWIVGIPVAVIIGLIAIGNAETDDPTVAPTVTAGPVERSEVGSGQTEEPEIEPPTEAPEPEPEPEPTLTRAQSEAVESAESYLDSSSFSKKELLNQLTSEYGEDFAKKDAAFAVAYVEKTGAANWKAEAVEAAESYLDSGGYSKNELIHQLESPYGEQFTHAEAVYAVNKVY